MEKLTESKNGIKIYSYKNSSLHGFYISLFLRGGSMYESESESGITHFLEHILIRNVNKESGGALYELLDRAGLEFNASSYAEMVQFYISGASEKFSLAADILPKLLSPIILDKKEIDAERRRIKAEIRESDDKNSLTTYSNQIIYEGASLSRSILGSNKSVDKMTRLRLEEYRKRVFTKENIFLYVSGSFTDRDIEYLCECFEQKSICSGEVHENFAPVPRNFCKREPAVNVKNADFTVARFSFDLDMSRLSLPETDLIYDILFSGYASRFFMEMSEKRGMFYDINGALERYRNIGELYFSFELREARMYDAIKISVEILNGMKKTLLSEDGLMKAAYVDNAYILFDDAREFNFTFAYDNHIMMLPYKTIEERKTAYSKISAERIREVACEIFKPENLTFTMKGKKRKIKTEKIMEILKELA